MERMITEDVARLMVGRLERRRNSPVQRQPDLRGLGPADRPLNHATPPPPRTSSPYPGLWPSDEHAKLDAGGTAEPRSS